MFEVVWRGYDRDQVDHHIRKLTLELGAERQRSATTRTELRRAQNDLANQRPAADTEDTQSFGHRVEKILRMAELEAAEIRRKATDEASALMEKARVEAEAYRHDAERQLINRATQLDQEAARRSSAIQERETEVAGELAAAKQRADEMRADAEQEAQRVREHAEALARQTRTQAEKAAQEQRELAAREVAHLAKVQDEARSGIRRLHRMLASELELSEALSGAEATPQPRSAPDAAGNNEKADADSTNSGGHSEEAADAAPAESR